MRSGSGFLIALTLRLPRVSAQAVVAGSSKAYVCPDVGFYFELVPPAGGFVEAALDVQFQVHLHRCTACAAASMRCRTADTQRLCDSCLVAGSLTPLQAERAHASVGLICVCLTVSGQQLQCRLSQHAL